MTLDEMIEKYGMHDLDIDYVQQINNETIIYAYCHQHNVNNQFMINHFLEIKGGISILEKTVEDENDIYFHLAVITKRNDGTYEIYGALTSDWLHFRIDGELKVNELTEKEYNKSIKFHEKK